MAKDLQYNATVVSKTMLSEHLMVIGVKPDDGQISFVSGQYATLGLLGSAPRVGVFNNENPVDDALVRRAYSIASSPDQDVLEFYIALVDDGALTTRLFALNLHDRLFISKKAVGRFTLEEVESNKSLLLMSTGTGLAPYISMIRGNKDIAKDRHVFVLHGVRHEIDLGYKQELEKQAQSNQNLHYVPVLSRKSESWTGTIGYIQNVLFDGMVEKKSGLELTPENFEAFLCGNPAMIEQAIEKLEKIGFVLTKARQKGTIHIEEYW